MKKIASILLVMAMILSLPFALFSCDKTPDSENDTNNDTVPGQVTEEQWNNAKEEAKFDNVRVDFTAEFISGYNPGTIETDWFELDGDLVVVSGLVTDDEETVSAVKSIYVGTVTSILDNYSLFTFDSENGQYVSAGPIVYNVNVMGTDAKITAENIVVKIDKDLNIASVACKMTQEFKEKNERDKTYVLNIEFLFSNYGTTELTLEE